MKYTHTEYLPPPQKIKGVLAVLTLLWMPGTGYLKTYHAACMRPKMSVCIWPGITCPYVQPNHSLNNLFFFCHSSNFFQDGIS